MWQEHEFEVGYQRTIGGFCYQSYHFPHESFTNLEKKVWLEIKNVVAETI